MTRAACELILRISTVCLAWRTIKALKRTGTKRHGLQNNSNVDHVEIDWEILQLWALYALHVLYVSSGAEWFISFFPLYYYLKMIILLITAIPATKFPNFWFEIALVPMMQRAHELLNVDWKGFLEKEVVLLPWQILDLFILPGLISDAEAMIVKKLREEQLREALALAAQHTFVYESNDEDVDDKPTPTTTTTTSKDSPRSEPSSKPSPEKSPSPSRRRVKVPPIPLSSITLPVARSRVAASSLHLRKFSIEHRHSAPSTSTRTKVRPTPETASPPKRQSTNTSARRTSKIPSGPNSGVNSGVNRRKTMDKTDTMQDNASTNKSVRRPPMVAFKQTQASALSQKLKSPVRSLKPEERISISKREKDANHLRSLMQDDDDDMSISSRRSSVGTSVRKFITGDQNIRIRDFLFDLELPSIPSPKRVSNADDFSVRTSESSKHRRSARMMSVSDDRRKALEEFKKTRGLGGSQGSTSSLRPSNRNSEKTESSKTRPPSRNGTGTKSNAATTSRTRESRPQPESSATGSNNVSVRRSSRIATREEAD